MIMLVKSKVQELEYNNLDSVNELHKLLNISKFAIKDASRSFSPPFQEYLIAIGELDEIKNKEQAGDYQKQFLELKQEILQVFTKLQNFILNNNAHKSKSMNVLFYGDGGVRQQDRIDFALLMVEQNNVDFFKPRESHLPSQPHDRLLSHYIIHTDNGRINMRFLDETDIPIYIQEEALKAFNEAGEQTEN